MTDTNPLLTTLYVIRSAGEIRPTAEWLCNYYGLSDRTLKRYIDDARQLGADLRPVKLNDGRYHWTCANWESLEATGRLARWIDLEQSRNLL